MCTRPPNVARPVIRRTPVMTSRSVNEKSGVAAFLKCENLQRTGSFKLRGASNFVLSIRRRTCTRRRGILLRQPCASRGEGIPYVGTKATIVMPLDAPKSKVEGTRANGASIVTYDRFREDREAIGARIAADTGATLVPPYDHPWTMAGQGSAALELLQEVGDLEALIVCVGGGGLISGCATIAKAMLPAIRIFGAEPELANDTYLSMQKGERVETPPSATIADGLRSPQPGALTFPVIQEHVESILLVSEREIRETMRFLLLRMKILVEPSGAVSAAALLFRKFPPELKRIGVILSGGNMDPDLLSEILALQE